MTDFGVYQGYRWPPGPWQSMFCILPRKIETLDGKNQWVIFRRIFRQKGSYLNGGAYRYRYRLPKDHFILELKGDGWDS